MPSDTLTEEAAQPLLHPHGPHRSGPGLTVGKAGRGPMLLILSEDFAFASQLARLAEGHGVAVALCWHLTELSDLPFVKFAVVMVDEQMWQRLQRLPELKVWQRLKAAPLIVLHDGVGALTDLNGVNMLPKAQGAVNVMAAALKITEPHDRHSHEVH